MSVEKAKVRLMQKALSDLPSDEREAYVRARIEDGSLPGTLKEVSIKAMLGACALMRANDLTRVYYEVLLRDRGEDVVAGQVSLGLEATAFVRIFGVQSVTKLPDEVRNAVKRKMIEGDFGL